MTLVLLVLVYAVADKYQVQFVKDNIVQLFQTHAQGNTIFSGATGSFSGFKLLINTIYGSTISPLDPIRTIAVCEAVKNLEVFCANHEIRLRNLLEGTPDFGANIVFKITPVPQVTMFPLHQAARRGDVAQIRSLLKPRMEQLDFNWVNEQER